MLVTFKTFLKEKIRLSHNVYLFRFGLLQPKEVNFIPGQYLLLKIKDKFRSYSIASSSLVKDFFDLIIEIVDEGLASTYLLNLKLNEEVIFKGPAGVFRLRNSFFSKVFLATGTGIAPILSMIETYFNNFKKEKNSPKFNLFWGLSNFSDIYLIDKIIMIKNKSKGNFNFWICLSKEKKINKNFLIAGRVNIGLEKIIGEKNYKNFEFYICGARETVESLKNYLLDHEVKREQIFFEKF